MLREVQLGDVIDDFCVRCKRIMNHSVVSVMNKEPAKVRCRTCYSDHDYRHELPPAPKVDPRKAAFNEVLAKVTDAPAAAQAGNAAEAGKAAGDGKPAEAAKVDEPVEADEAPEPKAKRAKKSK